MIDTANHGKIKVVDTEILHSKNELKIENTHKREKSVNMKGSSAKKQK